MPVRFERADNLLRIILEGQVVIEDMYAGVDEIYVAEVPELILWDSRNAEETEDAHDAAELLKGFSAYAVEKGKDRRNSRVALLSPSDLTFGLARMSTAYAEQNQAAYNMQVFREEAEALAWLRGETS